MTVPKETIWEIEPHTLAKHEILRRYLNAWFPILNRWNKRIIYIDGFCGPGRYKNGEPGSPLIALDVAMNHRRKMTGEVIFWFIDERRDRIAHLKQELTGLSIPAHFKVRVECGHFDGRLECLLNCLDERGLSLAPTFTFIDPFGFSGIPFSLIERLLKREKCEALITFQVEAIYRFSQHQRDEVEKHIVDVFGTKKDAIRIARSSGDPIRALRELYQRQLKTAAKFVRYFEMRDLHNKPIYYLFFATNHPLGHVKMKEAMWAVDPEGQFRFSDATDPDQLVLFETDPIPQLTQTLVAQFQSKGRICVKQVREYTEDETPYVKKQLKKALTQLESDGAVRVQPKKANKQRRRAGSYPDDAIISFHKGGLPR